MWPKENGWYHRINRALVMWSGRPDSNRRSSAPKADAITKLRYAPKPTYFPLAHDGKQEKDDLFWAKRGTHVAKIYAMGFQNLLQRRFGDLHFLFSQSLSFFGVEMLV